MTDDDVAQMLRCDGATFRSTYPDDRADTEQLLAGVLARLGLDPQLMEEQHGQKAQLPESR